MDLSTALTYELLARYLVPVLPHSMRKHLEPDFQQARQVLNMLHSAPLGRWSKRIAVLPPGFQLVPPEVRQDVSDVVYEALLHGKQVQAAYRSLGARAPKQSVFNPQGLIYRQGVVYVVATLWDYTDIRQFALHRISTAQLLKVPSLAIEDFDLDRYVHDEMPFDFPTGKNISLELIVSPWIERYLEERKLAANQRIAPIRGDERKRVSASVAETEQLHRWLRSLSADVEVRKPASLREKMANHAADVLAKYR